MQIDIQAKSFVLTNRLKKHTEQKLKPSLSACGSRLKKVVIRLSNIKQSRSGKDKLCHIQVIPAQAGKPDVIINSTDKDMYKAIDKAAYLLAS